MYRPLLWLVIISVFGFSHSQFCFSCCHFYFQRKKCNNTLTPLEFKLDDVNKASCREDAWILAGEKVFFQNSSLGLFFWTFLFICLFVFFPPMTVPFLQYFAPLHCTGCSKLAWGVTGKGAAVCHLVVLKLHAFPYWHIARRLPFLTSQCF